MMINPVAAVDALGFQAVLPQMLPKTAEASTQSFTEILRNGIDTTNNKIAEADRMVTAFALDGSIPAHQITFALEEARLSLELMLQVRNRMLEAYQQMMQMQV
jgi:flagellar hook-basal body complex protein FliE